MMRNLETARERERERSEYESIVPVLNEPCPDLSKPPVFMMNLNIFLRGQQAEDVG